MDPRAEFTEKIIREAFLLLLREKPVGRITVTELIQKAGINRTTFYKHYLDIPDLLEKTENELLDSLRQLIPETWADTKDLERTTASVFSYIQQYWQQYIPLGSQNGDPMLASKTFTLLYETAYPVLVGHMPEKTEEERQILYSYLSQGCGGVLLWWLQSGMNISPEELARIILTFSMKVVQ